MSSPVQIEYFICDNRGSDYTPSVVLLFLWPPVILITIISLSDNSEYDTPISAQFGDFHQFSLLFHNMPDWMNLRFNPCEMVLMFLGKSLSNVRWMVVTSLFSFQTHTNMLLVSNVSNYSLQYVCM